MNKSLKEKEFLHQVTIRMCGTLDISWGLKRTQDYLNKFIPMDSLILYWEDVEKKTIRMVADTKRDNKVVNKTSKLPDFVLERVKKILTLSDAKVYNYDDEDKIHLHMIKLAGYKGRSALVGRLRKDGKYIGGVAAVGNPGQKYDESQRDLFTLISDPFSMALANFKWHEEIVQLRESLLDQKAFIRKMRGKKCNEVVGAESGMKEVMNYVEQVAHVDTLVLILGETGVGKEIVANEIHQRSVRYDKPFIKVNCGAISDSLIESELFGHEKGAFTGAVNKKAGYFERANKGTIFLDEIGELPLNAQVKLLRVLQNNEITRVGGDKTISVDVRIIAATHRRVEEMVEEGTFRKDMWYRINVFQIKIPPLRERAEDIPELVEYFIRKKSSELNISQKIEYNIDEIAKLKNWHWRGNVRELENIIERELIRHNKGTLTFRLPARKGCSSGHKNQMALDKVIKDHILNVLKYTGGKINGSGGAAEILRLNPSTLRSKIKKMSINLADIK